MHAPVTTACNTYKLLPAGISRCRTRQKNTAFAPHGHNNYGECSLHHHVQPSFGNGDKNLHYVHVNKNPKGHTWQGLPS